MLPAVDPLHLLGEALARATLPTTAAEPDRDRRRARGVVYTPPPLVQFVVEQTLTPLLATAPPSLTVLDPACGDGRFLLAAARLLANVHPAATLRLIGIERDPRAAAVARAALDAALAPAVPGSPDAAAAPASASAVILEGEALLGVSIEASVAAPIDAVIGNPPYVRAVHLRAHDRALWQALRHRFAATSHGEWDLYAAFLERSLGWVRRGGRVGLVVPSRWLTAAFAARLRAAIAAEVTAIVDFGAHQVFPGATTYASVVLLESGRAAGPATFARHTPRGWTRCEQVLPAGQPGPWILRAGPARTLPDTGAGTVGDHLQVAKGCGTNADKIFVVRGRIDGEHLVGQNGLGQPVRVEAAAARPCLRGRDVEAAQPGAERDFCLLPYRVNAARPDETASAKLRPLAELWDEQPGLAAYLAGHRAALEARERGRFAGAQFHRFGRPQNLAFLLDPTPKLVIPDVTARGRAMIDVGSLVLDSAYALRPRATAPAPWQSLPLLAALLRSPAVRLWLNMVGVPLRGDYMRMKTAFLAPMPLPLDGPALRRAAAAASAGESALTSEALREAYGIAHSTWASALPT